jgi:hypothetical protein
MTTAMPPIEPSTQPRLEELPGQAEPLDLIGRVRHFFFRPTSANDLGICRVLFFACLFIQYLGTDFASYGDLPASFYNTLPLFRLLHIPILSAKYLAMLEGAFKLSLLGACLGRYTKLSTFIAAITGSYLLAVPNNFGRAGHGDGVIIILLWVLAISYCGDAWSLDRWLSRRSSAAGPPTPPATLASDEYTWPIRMVWVLMSLVYFGAGFTKLHASGLAWVTSDNMAMTFLAHQVNNSNPLLDWGQRLAHFGWFNKGLAGFTIVLELGFPLALFNRTARKLWVPGMFLAHVGIALLMGVVFLQFMYTYIFWIPWSRLSSDHGVHRQVF